MVNNNFYATINSLVAKASGVSDSGIIDYSSFIEAGKKITDIQYTNLQNNFITSLMNRISFVINTARSYDGAYAELTRGNIEMGNTIELIIQKFYDAEAAEFINLTNGQSVDQYKIYKPQVDVDYYVDTVAYKIPITIQYDQLKKAFESPASMETFISGVIMYVMNSNELRRENGRIALVADLIVKLSSETAATDSNEPAQNYPLLTLYNGITNAGLTADKALYNEEFVKYAVKTIKQVTEKTKKVSTSYNKTGIKTFTKPENRHLFVNSAVVSSMEAYIKTNNYNPEASMLKDYIDVPYWQSESAPFVVTYANPDFDPETAESEENPKTLTTAPVLAVMCDKFAIGEYVRKQDMRTSPFNANGEYWNNFLNVELKYLTCDSANAVIFTLS